MTNLPLTEEQAEAIYDVLVKHADAPDGARTAFVDAQTRQHMTEWRFIGALGFGGKFWRTTGGRLGGTWGEVWYVTCYAEHMTDARRTMIDNTNRALAALQDSHAH